MIRQQTVRWFALQNGVYQELRADVDSVFKSTVFPGLWLHREALCQIDVSQVMATLRQGLASPGHAVFVENLRSRRESLP